jgi:putative spermidine/putrescine transport system ATP-binding protein
VTPASVDSELGPSLATARASAAVRLEGVHKQFGEIEAVQSLDLEIERGELLTLLGPSGSGKSTVLRMIAGLVKPTTGRIWIGDEEVGAHPTHERDIAMVFQSLALFPHMDVFANVAFPLRMRRLGRKEIASRVTEALSIVRLPDIERRRVDELSGGQRQRVAIARALVYQPQLLLLDEPFGALDRRLREEMQLEIVRLHRALDVTIVNVTHDQREALMLSDRIAVMNGGRLEQLGSSEAIYRAPATRFVAEFLGDANLIEGVLEADGGGALRTASGRSIPVPGAPGELVGTTCAVALKSEAIELERLSDPAADNCLTGVVRLGVFEGGARYYEVDVAELDMRFKLSLPAAGGRNSFEIGDRVGLRWDAADAHLVSAAAGASAPG